MAEVLLGVLAPTGSTGNNTHTAYSVGQMGNLRVTWQFVVEAVGATPTVTFKIQGSLDNTNWYDMFYITDSSSTESATPITVTAVGAKYLTTSMTSFRHYNYYRLVTTANTNVTYRGEIYVEQNRG